MLSETEMTARTMEKSLFECPCLERPVTVRLRFRKVGRLQYISHLDLQRTFGRLVSRAGIPVWYTKGFNPHPKLVFGMPLSVGMESECEYLDLRIDRDVAPSAIMERMNRCLTEELCILDAYFPERAFSEIAFAQYEIDLHSERIHTGLAESVKAFLTTSPLMITRHGKAGDRTEDMIPLIESVRVTAAEGDAHLSLLLRAGTGALNPEFVITALKERFGILCTDPMTEYYRILRQQLFLADGKTVFC